MRESKTPWHLNIAMQKPSFDNAHADKMDASYNLNRKKINRKKLINKLNYYNFNNNPILIELKHKKYNNEMYLEAIPEPCSDNILDCRWAANQGLERDINNYDVQHFILSDGFEFIVVEATVKEINKIGVKFDLPDTCLELTARKVKRHSCHNVQDVQVELIQNSVVFQGVLKEFSALAFKVEINPIPPQTFQWIRQEVNIYLIIKSSRFVIYTGECKIIRIGENEQNRSYVLEPIIKNLNRFARKEFRNDRQVLNPSPIMTFEHPLTSQVISMTVQDISGCGLSVVENCANPVLIPGMIIQDLEIEFMQNSSIRCNAQVIYCNLSKQYDQYLVKCGIAIIDIDNVDQLRLFNVLERARNNKTAVSNKIDLERLWKFFFESGFIYPSKYKHFQTYAENIKETYRKLYQKPCNIFKHIVNQHRREIIAHMSMVQFYNRSWLIHHLTSAKASINDGGIVVLNQIGRLGNISHNTYNSNMDYLICYFRPENRFPKRVFGGFCAYINNSKICSIDSFSYLHLNRKIVSNIESYNHSIQLVNTNSEDLVELESYYEYISGGLMIDALDLRPEHSDLQMLSEEYKKNNLKRDRYIFSLKEGRVLIAIIIINISDIYLNMSNLTNCIKIIIINQKKFRQELIKYTVQKFSQYFGQEDITTLIFPASFSDDNNIIVEKIYNLWIINLQYTDSYFKYINKILFKK